MAGRQSSIDAVVTFIAAAATIIVEAAVVATVTVEVVAEMTIKFKRIVTTTTFPSLTLILPLTLPLPLLLLLLSLLLLFLAARPRCYCPHMPLKSALTASPCASAYNRRSTSVRVPVLGTIATMEIVGL
jgi:hypothetical protein